MTPEQKEALFGNTARAMDGVPDLIKDRHIAHCMLCDPGVAQALGRPIPKV